MEGYYSEEELHKLGFKEIGENVLISKKASIYGAGQMRIGSNVRIDDFCMLLGQVTIGNYIHLAPFSSIHGTGGGSVELKDFVAISGYSTIYAASDDYSGESLINPMVDEEFVKVKKSHVLLEKHVVVGLHSVLLPGAYMAEGTALGAMSLLAKETKAWGIYVGIPCRRIKERKRKMLALEEEFLKKHIIIEKG